MSSPTDGWEAVVFDCDGVILDTEECWTRAEVGLFAANGRTFTAEHKRRMLGIGGPAAGRLLEVMLGQPGRADALLAELHRLAGAEFASHASATEGAVELLRELRQVVPVGLASNTPRALVEVALKRSGVGRGSFDAVVCADEVDRPKPAPDIYLEACARLGVAPTRSVAVEDSPAGVEAARAAGLAVIGIRSVPGVRLDVDHVFSSLAHEGMHAAVGITSRAQ